VLTDEGEQPRVWITSFWGFDPENEGYLGFTYEGNRKWFLDHWREGDLILIYGADAPKTEPEKRHRAIGFLEIEPTPIVDRDRLSPIGLKRKEDNGWLERWTYAVPVIRAAQVLRPISIAHIATKTLVSNQARIIASRGAVLTPEEAKVALSLQVKPINVFGMEPLPEGALQKIFKPSRGIDPTFGDRSSTLVDGEHFLYVLRLEGDPARLLDRKPFELRGKAIFKVGYSNDPKRRCEEHNAGFPPATNIRWKPEFQSRSFPNGQAAKDAEDALKAALAARGESLGGEFFLCDPATIQSAFAVASMATAAMTIKA
jgi:hypothetical protein